MKTAAIRNANVRRMTDKIYISENRMMFLWKNEMEQAIFLIVQRSQARVFCSCACVYICTRHENYIII